MTQLLYLNEYDADAGTGRRPGPLQFEFHILRAARDLYELQDAIFALDGNMLFVDVRAVRLLAHRMNARRDLRKTPHLGVLPSSLYAIGLIDEIFHYIVRLYEQSVNPGVFGRAYQTLGQSLGIGARSRLLEKFTGIYPPTDVYRGRISADDYPGGGTLGRPNIEILLEEIIHVSLANFNPAFGIVRELFDDAGLRNETPYDESVKDLEKFFAREKPFGPRHQDLLTLLRAPILASPNSLEGQLAYIRKHWGRFLSDALLMRMKQAGDLMREEFRAVGHGGGAGPGRAPKYSGDEAAEYMLDDAERFTPDIDWMPNVVLLAKNSYVWLDQLSRTYGRPITTLDQIPDEELDRIARWRFTGLWLIGVWERSRASQRIKQMTGNPEAVASAYSLFDYEIAGDLGGDQAYRNLRHRAWERGIRLAGDMVPNHVGLYSRWVLEHPEYFIQTPYPPFPNYRFTGTDLSDTPGIELRIEDGYWSRTDAAVVFQRIDRRTGQVAYIYHGNDGTNMPWNDTAQLNFLAREVREAVIGSIFHVARKFSIIRFDAAMVLAKKHFQRLWYPEPGTGGAIPSRAEHAIGRPEFEQLFPVEFWREVVDRINSELPDTLLLAEAFWLLEGYFVRTLGMHRVYNSAFMHMLMKEENAKYRELIRNTLQYNPEILKRYVNFMSNPDEKTAVEQFGTGDKYFGIATLMVTLPGLPMFAHGQIDGFREKYGMEYRRAYYEEQTDWDLVRRHEREIFPLVHKRHLFSQVVNFELYDAGSAHGGCDENVFAYSNRSGGERAFVCYNNRYGDTDVWIGQSVGKVRREGDADPVFGTLAGAFGFRADERFYYIFRDFSSGLEYLRTGRELCDRGFFIHLHAYECRVFLDIQEVDDHAGLFGPLAHRIGHQPVPSVWNAARELRLSPLHDAFGALLGAMEQRMSAPAGDDRTENALAEQVRRFAATAAEIGGAVLDPVQWTKDINRALGAAVDFFPASGIRKRGSAGKKGLFDIPDEPGERFIFRLRLLLEKILLSGGSEAWEGMQLDTAVIRACERAMLPERDAGEDLLLVKNLTRNLRHSSAGTAGGYESALLSFLGEPDCGRFIQLHDFEGTAWYRKESFERLVRWFTAVRYIDAVRDIPASRRGAFRRREGLAMRKVLAASDASGYRFAQLKSSLTKPTRPARRVPRPR